MNGAPVDIARSWTLQIFCAGTSARGQLALLVLPADRVLAMVVQQGRLAPAQLLDAVLNGSGAGKLGLGHGPGVYGEEPPRTIPGVLGSLSASVVAEGQ